MRNGISFSVTAAELDRLRGVVKDRNAPQKHVWRAQIVLLSAEGAGTNAIIARDWQVQDLRLALAGTLRRRRRGRASARQDAALAHPEARSSDRRARRHADNGGAVGRSDALDWRGDGRGGWRQRHLGPAHLARAWAPAHRVRQFKLSKDPEFVDKLRHIVGLYVDPPAHAIVLSVDEKSQIQALDRTQPGLPIGAICPARGVGAVLALPYADADMMQLHLDEISRNVADGAHAVLLLDRAGWHTTGKLDVPDNITPIFLPSRAPELNPVENVWQYLRQNWLSNTVFENYDAIIDAARAAWRKLIAQPETITSIGMRDWAHVGQTL